MSNGFLLAGQRYEWRPLHEITVGDQIRVETWLRRNGSEYTEAKTWDDILAIAVEIDSLPDAEAQRQHPEFKLSLAMAIWAAKRMAGEDVMPTDCMGWVWDDLSYWSDEPEGKGPAAP